MSPTTWFRRLLNPPRRTVSRRRPLYLEQLEDRLVPAAGISLQQWANVSAAWVNGQLNTTKAECRVDSPQLLAGL